MQDKSLIFKSKGNVISKKIRILESTKQMQLLANSSAWNILKLLSLKPSYPAEVAQKLGIHKQSAYYYMHRLIEYGIIEQVGIQTVRGGSARIYRPAAPAFGIEMAWGDTSIENNENESDIEFAREFFENYIVDNKFDGLFVVGSPDPHGPFRASARDGHYAIQLAFFLGSMCKIDRNFIVKLDVDAKAENIIEKSNDNIILIGGPGTNVITSEFNKHLPIKFAESNFWSGLQDPHGGSYNLDNHGLIAKIKNPYNTKKSVIIIAGVRSIGTKSAVIALTNFSEKILSDYENGNSDWAAVVEGFDMDSDGKIDYIEIARKIRIQAEK